MDQQQQVDIVRRWVVEIVSGLNLCPFAAPVIKADNLRIVACDSDDQDVQLKLFLNELALLHSSPEASIATSLLVFPRGLADFNDYLGFAEQANELLVEAGLEGIIQLATFHPEYLFADEDPADVSHYTNRAPFPLLHLIREEQMEQVLKRYPHPEKIPENNICLLRKLGLDEIKALFEKLVIVNHSE
jgi:hypothetical protein